MADYKLKITKEDLIREISDTTYTSQTSVRSFFDCLEQYVFEHLSMVDEEQDVVIKLFEGFNITGTYSHQKEKYNNFTRDKIIVDSKIKPKGNFTRSYCERLSSTLKNK